MNFDNLTHYVYLALHVDPFAFDFAPTLTVFPKLRNSMRENNIHSVETVHEVSQKPNVKIVTYEKQKTRSKGKAK